jgi:hypothetical protein
MMIVMSTAPGVISTFACTPAIAICGGAASASGVRRNSWGIYEINHVHILGDALSGSRCCGVLAGHKEDLCTEPTNGISL